METKVQTDEQELNRCLSEINNLKVWKDSFICCTCLFAFIVWSITNLSNFLFKVGLKLIGGFMQAFWLPTLRNLVVKINETFSHNFQEMAVAGEVSLGIFFDYHIKSDISY